MTKQELIRRLDTMSDLDDLPVGVSKGGSLVPIETVGVWTEQVLSEAERKRFPTASL